jgi:Lysyl oxidase
VAIFGQVRIARQLLLALGLACVAAASAHAATTALLPDLVQKYPREVQVETDASSGTPHYLIGFLSAVNNFGAGPLIVHGHRPDAFQPAMTGDQVIENADGSRTVRPDIGRLMYVNAITHQHWHYLGFDRYELRRPSDNTPIAPDQKSGFCLGDRYEAFSETPVRGKPKDPVYTGNCAPNDPQALEVTEGISVGYGDDYAPIKEGQDVDVTGVPAGRYYLVHRVNSDRSLLETNYANDASSVLVDLEWPNGTQSAPTVKVLNTCSRTDRCPIPIMTRRKASGLAASAIDRSLHHSARTKPKCKVASSSAATCKATFRDRRRTLSAVVGVRYVFPGGLQYWTYRVTLHAGKKPLPGVFGRVPLYE